MAPGACPLPGRLTTTCRARTTQEVHFLPPILFVQKRTKISGTKNFGPYRDFAPWEEGARSLASPPRVNPVERRRNVPQASVTDGPRCASRMPGARAQFSLGQERPRPCPVQFLHFRSNNLGVTQSRSRFRRGCLLRRRSPRPADPRAGHAQRSYRTGGCEQKFLCLHRIIRIKSINP